MNKQKLDQHDIEAEREGKAIQRAFKSKTIVTLKKIYKVDGEIFRTGEKHRMINRSF